MPVKDREELSELVRELENASEALGRARASVLREATELPGLTVRELAEHFHVSEDAIVAFVETVGELMGERPLNVETARRAALLAAAGQTWENELGPLLSSGQVRALLGDISRQRVDERLRSRRLIGLRDSGGRWRFPAFQFADGQPLQPLTSAFWTVAAGAISEWTAAAWCVAPDEALDGETPAAWAHSGNAPERLQQVAEQDRVRLAQ